MMVVLIIIALFLLYLLFGKNKPLSGRSTLRINNHPITVEIADNEISRSRGLSGREPLDEDSGMLFVYSTPGKYSFWMYRMKFPLDFIFINQEMVVDLIENVPPPKTGEIPKVVNAKTDFTQVLEVNAGTIAKYEIQVGQKVSLDLHFK